MSTGLKWARRGETSEVNAKGSGVNGPWSLFISVLLCFNVLHVVCFLPMTPEFVHRFTDRQ